MSKVNTFLAHSKSFDARFIQFVLYTRMLQFFREGAVPAGVQQQAAAPELRLPDLHVDVQAGTVTFNGKVYCGLKPDLVHGLHLCMEAGGEWVSWESHGITAPGRAKRGAPKELLNLIEHKPRYGHRLKRK